MMYTFMTLLEEREYAQTNGFVILVNGSVRCCCLLDTHGLSIALTVLNDSYPIDSLRRLQDLTVNSLERSLPCYEIVCLSELG
jgi:hypothetical protein